jgi:DNA-binding CsgD family transcriptional regulator
MRCEIAKRLAAGDTAYRIGKDMGISKNTVAKYAED